MLNYNEYTSCLDTRLYKSGREIGVTSHRRRDSRVWRRQSTPPPFFLIPNSAPQASRTSLLGAPHVTFSLTNSVSFFSTENRTCCTFGDHFDVYFVASETKRLEIYSLSFLDCVYDKSLCVIVGANR